ncbi:MAG TPA: sensor histidine kinase [Ktedonobacteraceae bacterium]
MKCLPRLRFPLLTWLATVRWKRLGQDSVFALSGVALVTGTIAGIHLFPRIQTISLVYLIVILALASTRGLYAAILASLLASLSVDFFFVPPSYTLAVFQVEDLLTLFVFLIAAILTSQLASALRRRVEQANVRERELRLLYEQASVRERELRLLYEQAQELAALQERQHLARELHDSVSQVLYSMSLGAHTVLDALESKELEQARISAHYVISLVEAGLTEMRALIFELRPESLETEGLVAAFNRQVAVLRTRHKLAVQFDLEKEPDLPLEKKEALYRIAQEALHNIVKHARASTVVLQLIAQQDEIVLEIRDNGRGFDPTELFLGHLGLHSMRERATKVGGTLIIKSTPGKETMIRACIPLAVEDEESAFSSQDASTC